MTKSQRQKYGLGSFIKKQLKKLKKYSKVWKSPLGKAALIGAVVYGSLGKFGVEERLGSW